MAYKTWPHTPDAVDTLQNAVVVDPGKNHIVTHALITNTDGANPVDVTVVMLDDTDTQQGVLYNNSLAAGANENKRLNVPLPAGYKIAVKASVVDVASFVFIGEEFFTLGADNFPVDALADYAEKFTDTAYMDQAVANASEMDLLCSNPVTINAIAAHPTFRAKMSSSVMALGKWVAGRLGFVPANYADIYAALGDTALMDQWKANILSLAYTFDSNVALGKFLAHTAGETPANYDDLDDFLINGGPWENTIFTEPDFLHLCLSSDPTSLIKAIANAGWFDIAMSKTDAEVGNLTSAIINAASGDSRFSISSQGIEESATVDLRDSNSRIILLDITGDTFYIGEYIRVSPNFTGNLDYDIHGYVGRNFMPVWGGAKIYNSTMPSPGSNAITVIELA